MTPTVVQLIGPPAAGKLTVAREVVERLGDEAVLLDNHTFSNPFLALLPRGTSPVPNEVWDYARRFKATVLEASEALAPPTWSFVFTNYWTAQDPGDSFARTVAFAEARRSTLVPVVLECPAEELRARVANEDRRARRKLVDPELLMSLLDRGTFVPDHPNLLCLSTHPASPSEVAERVVQHARVAPSR